MRKLTDITIESLAGMIDQTLLRADAQEKELIDFCEESATYGFKAVTVNPAAVFLCRQSLVGSKVLVCTTVGFPLGQNTLEAKAFETADAIEKGAQEIDYVINIGEMKNKNYEYIKKEMDTLVKTCKRSSVTIKVIFENCYLTDEEKVRLCEIALQIGPHYIKTSTGFGSSSAIIADVALMKSTVGDKIKVKASGGIRDLNTTLKMINAGAERIGTSSGTAIVDKLVR